MTADGAVHTQLLSLPHPVTCTASLLPPQDTTSPLPPLYSPDQSNHSASNPHDPKESADPQRTPQNPADSTSRAHLIMTKELEALHMREDRDMPPIKSPTHPSTNHRVVKPHPIGSSWLLHHALYPEWSTFYQPCHPSPPPPPPPSLSYPFPTFSSNHDARAQAHVTSWYPGTWCFQCHLQDAPVHTRPYNCVPHRDLSSLPTVTSPSVTFPLSPPKEDAFSGSHFVLDEHNTETTLSLHK